MSSSNNHEQASSSSFSSGVRHPSLERIQRLGSNNTHVTWDDLIASDHRRTTAAQTVLLANQLQALQVNNDINMTSSEATIVDTASRQIQIDRDEAIAAEEELIERFKEIIKQFMTRPGRHRQHPYNKTISWTVSRGNYLNYSVVLLINEPSTLI